MLIQCEKCGTDYPSYFPERCPGCDLLQLVGNSSTLSEEHLHSLWDMKDQFKHIELLICISCGKLYYTAGAHSKWKVEHLCPESSCRHALVSTPSLDWENFNKINSFGGQVFFSYPEKYMEEQLEKYNLLEEEENLQSSLLVDSQSQTEKEILPQKPSPSLIPQEDFKKLVLLAILAVAGILIMAALSILSYLQR